MSKKKDLLESPYGKSQFFNISFPTWEIRSSFFVTFSGWGRLRHPLDDPPSRCLTLPTSGSPASLNYFPGRRPTGPSNKLCFFLTISPRTPPSPSTPEADRFFHAGN